MKCGNAPRKTDRLRRFFGTTIIVVVTLFSSVTPSIYSDSSEVGIRNYLVDLFKIYLKLLDFLENMKFVVKLKCNR